MQTKALKLRENFYWAGILDDTLRVFDIIMYTEFGTTYNSYIYKAGDKVILFETVKAKFFDDYLKTENELPNKKSYARTVDLDTGSRDAPRGKREQEERTCRPKP